MLRNFKIVTVSMLLILSTVALVFAADGVDDHGNPNDPLVNEDANSCFEGGEMEGKCDTDWEWNCGWYLIRYNEGVISAEEFPLECSSLLPEPLQPACNARNDFYALNPGDGAGVVSVPGVLANDGCSEVVSNSGATVLQGGVTSLSVNANGSFNYVVTEMGTIFSFTYTTENGSTATVTVQHDMEECGGLCPR